LTKPRKIYISFAADPELWPIVQDFMEQAEDLGIQVFRMAEEWSILDREARSLVQREIQEADLFLGVYAYAALTAVLEFHIAQTRRRPTLVFADPELEIPRALPLDRLQDELGRLLREWRPPPPKRAPEKPALAHWIAMGVGIPLLLAGWWRFLNDED